MQFAGSENFTSARQLTLSLYKWHSLSLMSILLKPCYVQIIGVRAIKPFGVLTGLQKSACGYRSFLCQYIMIRLFRFSLCVRLLLLFVVTDYDAVGFE